MIASSLAPGDLRDMTVPEQWPDRERPTHLVAGLLSDTLTVVAGDPAAGKTFLSVGIAAALLNGQAEFLGQEVTLGVDSVAFVCTDADGATSVRRRLLPLVDAPRAGRLLAVDYTAGGPVSWADQVSRVADVGPGLLVVDNVLGIAADVNDNGEAQRVLAPLLDLTRAGTAVLLLTHRGKPGPTGPAQGVNAAIGARTWTVPARVKATLTTKGNAGRRTLSALNNDGAPMAIDAHLGIVAGVPCWSRWTDEGNREQVAEGSGQTRWEALADRVVTEQPAGLTTRNALGRHYAAELGRTAQTIGKALGDLVLYNGERWEPMS